MFNPDVFIGRHEIENKVAELAERIRADYRQRNPLLVGALKGSFVFMADLVRALNMPLEVDFMIVSSYGSGEESSGQIKLLQDLRTPVKNREVLIVEDIIDTGLTSRFIIDRLSEREIVSVRVCTLLDKPSRRKVQVPVDYTGFTVPDTFLVGYGLDFAEQYRYLPDICALEGK
ncbi:MAG: hypoxanthine phosphoribosyltransferase [Dehalococcoidia bacterium]